MEPDMSIIRQIRDVIQRTPTYLESWVVVHLSMWAHNVEWGVPCGPTPGMIAP